MTRLHRLGFSIGCITEQVAAPLLAILAAAIFAPALPWIIERISQ